MKFELSKELKQVGDRIISECHQELQGLKIAWMFRDKATKSAGKVTLGKAIQVSDRDWLLHGYDAIVEIAFDMWKMADDRARDALLDHELAHIRWDGEVDPELNRNVVVVVGHDIEEFADVLRRRCCWHPALRGFMRAGEDHRKEYLHDNP
jgi:hypothetical protein